MKSQPLTVAIMVRNEDWFIENTIRSAQSVSDDVLVGDMESTDRSKQIALGLGARVMEVPTWLMVEQGWAACRNFMNTRAKYDWVLTLDADEIISPAGISILNKAEWPWASSFAVTPTVTYRGHVGFNIEQARKTPSASFPHRRMFDRKKIEWAGVIHEEPHLIGGLNVGTGQSSGVIREHFTNCRPKGITNWKWQVDAQLLLRVQSGDLPDRGMNQWWISTYLAKNYQKIVHRAKTFFKANPRFRHLVAGIGADMGLGYKPRTAVEKNQKKAILDIAATTKGPIVELGVDWGLTTVALARKFPDREVYAVDLWDQGYHSANLPDGKSSGRFKLEHVRQVTKHIPNVHVVVSDTASLSERWDHGEVGFIFSDGDHTEAGVQRDLKAWMPLMSSGGVIAVHDANRQAVVNACKKCFGKPAFRVDMCFWRKP